MRSIFFAAVALHLVKAVADNEFCLFVVAQIHQIMFDLVWIILVDLCHPSIGATLQAQRLEMHLEWFETGPKLLSSSAICLVGPVLRWQ